MKMKHDEKPIEVDADSLYVGGKFSANISGHFGELATLIKPVSDSSYQSALSRQGKDPADYRMIGTACLTLELVEWVKAAHAKCLLAREEDLAAEKAETSARWAKARAAAKGREVVRFLTSQADGWLSIYATEDGREIEGAKVEEIGEGFFALIAGSAAAPAPTSVPLSEVEEVANTKLLEKLELEEAANGRCPKCGTWCHGDCEVNS